MRMEKFNNPNSSGAPTTNVFRIVSDGSGVHAAAPRLKYIISNRVTLPNSFCAPGPVIQRVNWTSQWPWRVARCSFDHEDLSGIFWSKG